MVAAKSRDIAVALLALLVANSLLYFSLWVVRTPNGNKTVYVTRYGDCYHRAGCSSLDESKFEKPLQSAALGYRQCRNCKPPTLVIREKNQKIDLLSQFTFGSVMDALPPLIFAFLPMLWIASRIAEKASVDPEIIKLRWYFITGLLTILYFKAAYI